jgi:hypothetical protein
VATTPPIKQLLDARGMTQRGILVLPTEAAKITYEQLRVKYIADKPSREKETQLVHLDQFFKMMKAASITTDVLRKYITSVGSMSQIRPFAGSWFFSAPCSNWPRRRRRCPMTRCLIFRCLMTPWRRVSTSRRNNSTRCYLFCQTVHNANRIESATVL